MAKNNRTEGSEVLAIPEERGVGIFLSDETVSQVKEFYKKFEEVKHAILNEQDYADIPTREGTQKFIKRSGWEKIAKLFNLSVEIIQKERIVDTRTGKITYLYTVKVIAPNGAYAVAEGVCSSDEKGKEGKPEFVLSGTAQTRAFNRAVRTLVGGGGLSYEEVEGIDLTEEGEEKEEVRKPRVRKVNNSNGEDEEIIFSDAEDEPATEKQIKLLERLIKEGWDIPKDIDIYSLSKREASKLIDETFRRGKER